MEFMAGERLRRAIRARQSHSLLGPLVDDGSEMRDKDALGLAMSFTYDIVSAEESTGPGFIGNGDRKSKVLAGGLAYSVADEQLT